MPPNVEFGGRPSRAQPRTSHVDEGPFREHRGCVPRRHRRRGHRRRTGSAPTGARRSRMRGRVRRKWCSPHSGRVHQYPIPGPRTARPRSSGGTGPMDGPSREMPRSRTGRCNPATSREQDRLRPEHRQETRQDRSRCKWPTGPRPPRAPARQSLASPSRWCQRETGTSRRSRTTRPCRLPSRDPPSHPRPQRQDSDECGPAGHHRETGKRRWSGPHVAMAGCTGPGSFWTCVDCCLLLRLCRCWWRAAGRRRLGPLRRR